MAAFMKSLFALGLAVLSFIPAARAQAPAQAGGQPQAAPPQIPTYYVVSLALGPNFDPKLPLMEQPNIARHSAYMGRLTREGRLLLGGPFVDKPGSMKMTSAILILAAQSLEDARKIEEDDPAVATGLVTIAEIKPMLGFAGAWLRTGSSQIPSSGTSR